MNNLDAKDYARQFREAQDKGERYRTIVLSHESQVDQLCNFAIKYDWAAISVWPSGNSTRVLFKWGGG